MTPRAHQPGFEIAAALVAGAFGWAATCSWRGMVVDPSRYLAPTLVAALLIAVIGAGGRSLRLRWYAVLGIQLVALLVWFHHRQNGDGFAAGWIPTPHGVAVVIDQIRDGASAVNTYIAPVGREFADAPVYLIACAVVVLVLIDLIACGLRLPAWSGLPALVSVTVPISVLDGGLPTEVYLATGLLYALLLTVLEADRAVSWGPVVEETGGQTPRARRIPLAGFGVPALLIGTAATLLALVVSLGMPVGNGLIGNRSGGGPGAGGSGQITLSNPLVDLRRDLVANDHIPLLEVRTDSRDLSYLRLTILDSFAEDSWTPSPRDLGRQADGQLPSPPGLSSARTGTESFWQLITTPNFETTWLPTPSVTHRIGIRGGDWRYDPDFLDIANADNEPPTRVEYDLDASRPIIDAADLAASAPPPANLVRTMTALPRLPSPVTEIARSVTAAGRNDHAKAVLLQNWFRSTGGFSYSLAPAEGDGLEQLARFITTDKVGYCEQYAAAMAVMARAIGLPARVVVGFLSPSETFLGGYRYTSDDLHAWPEIYFSGAGWVRFEPTPSARTGASPPWTQSDVVPPGPSPSPPTSTRTPGQQPSRAPVPAPGSTTADADSGTGPVPAVVVVAGGIALLLSLLAAPALVRTHQRRRRYRTGSTSRAEVEALWHELRATAIDIGAPWAAGRSPRMDAEEIRSWVDSAVASVVSNQDHAALDALVTLVEQARYGGAFEFRAGDRDTAVAATRRWSALIQGSVRPRRRWRARLVPPSVGRRT